MKRSAGHVAAAWASCLLDAWTCKLGRCMTRACLISRRAQQHVASSRPHEGSRKLLGLGSSGPCTSASAPPRGRTLQHGTCVHQNMVTRTKYGPTDCSLCRGMQGNASAPPRGQILQQGPMQPSPPSLWGPASAAPEPPPQQPCRPPPSLMRRSGSTRRTLSAPAWPAAQPAG